MILKRKKIKMNLLQNHTESVSGRGGGIDKLCIARKIQEISEKNVILKRNICS